MTNKLNHGENYSTLVIHSTDNTFGFGYRKNNDLESDELFIKKFDNDLCNSLINDELETSIKFHNLDLILGFLPKGAYLVGGYISCLLYTSPSPRDEL